VQVHGKARRIGVVGGDGYCSVMFCIVLWGRNIM